jgi:hypothetical protein
VTVEFDPISKGTFNGTLELHDNAAKNPQKISLSGTAQ